jgi:hypothetical protein
MTVAELSQSEAYVASRRTLWIMAVTMLLFSTLLVETLLVLLGRLVSAADAASTRGAQQISQGDLGLIVSP